MSEVDPSSGYEPNNGVGSFDIKRRRHGYIPIRVLVDVEDIEGDTKLLAASIVLTVKLQSHLQTVLERQVQLVLHSTERSSLDSRIYFPFDALEGLADALTEAAAAKWLLLQASTFVGEEYRGKITRALIQTGVLRWVYDERELHELPFEIDDLVFERDVVFARQEASAAQQTETVSITKADEGNKTEVDKKGLKLALGPVSIAALGVLIVYNIIQQQIDSRSMKQVHELLLDLQVAELERARNVIGVQASDAGEPISVSIYINERVRTDESALETTSDGIVSQQVGSMRIITVPDR